MDWVNRPNLNFSVDAFRQFLVLRTAAEQLVVGRIPTGEWALEVYSTGRAKLRDADEDRRSHEPAKGSIQQPGDQLPGRESFIRRRAAYKRAIWKPRAAPCWRDDRLHL